MKPQTFSALLIAAIVTSAFAIVSYASNNRVARPKVAGAPLVSGLAANAPRIARLEISQGDKTIALANAGQGWVLASHANYPARAEVVRGLLVKMAEADLVEPKTNVKERFGLLELEDPAGKDAKSRLVRLLDAKGAVITEVVVGKKRVDAFGANRSGTYVRRPGDTQTWLASADLEASLSAKDWVAPAILDVQPAKIASLTIEMPGEPALKLVRDAAGGPTPKFNIAGLAADKKLKEGASPDTLVRAAATLDLDDVRKADPAAKADVGTLTIEGEKGLKVVIGLRKSGDDTWATIVATGSDDESKKHADEIAKKTYGFEFKLPAGKAAALLKKQADLVEG
jgi:hypothetical protein